MLRFYCVCNACEFSNTCTYVHCEVVQQFSSDIVQENKTGLTQEAISFDRSVGGALFEAKKVYTQIGRPSITGDHKRHKKVITVNHQLSARCRVSNKATPTQTISPLYVHTSTCTDTYVCVYNIFMTWKVVQLVTTRRLGWGRVKVAFADHTLVSGHSLVVCPSNGSDQLRKSSRF